MNKIKKHSITLSLKGEKITSDKLRNSIGAFYGFVDEIATQVSGEKKPIKWIVTVEKGSIVLVNEPEFEQKINNNITETIFDTIQKGINNLENRTERPPFFSDKALEYLQELASVPSARTNGLTGINITVNKKPHTLTTHVVANVDTILGVYSKGLGSVEGKLQTISERGSLRFIIYDSFTDKPIRCNITEELLLEATKAFGKRVYVFGMINYDQYGMPKGIQVRELSIFEERESIPSAFIICGILGE